MAVSGALALSLLAEASKVTVSPSGPAVDGGDLGAQPDRLVVLGDPLGQRGDQVLVGAGDELVHQLDHARSWCRVRSRRVAISRPMIPPPSTSSRSGMLSRSRAPVESMTRGSSCGMNGSVTGSEPAAMIAASKRDGGGRAVGAGDGDHVR